MDRSLLECALAISRVILAIAPFVLVWAIFARQKLLVMNGANGASAGVVAHSGAWRKKDVHICGREEGGRQQSGPTFTQASLLSTTCRDVVAIASKARLD